MPRNWPWLLLLLPLGLGLWIGREAAYRRDTGDGLASIGLAIEVGGLMLFFGILGLVALVARRPRGMFFGFAGAGLVVLGTFVATQLADPLGFGYQAPVVIESSGQATFELDGVANFVPKPSVAMSCASIGDSTATGTVTGLDLGELGPGTLRGTLSLDPATTVEHLSLFIDGGDLAEGAAQPFWEGDATLRDLSPDAISGTAAFRDLAYTDGAVSKGGPAPSGGTWPTTLTGTLHWNCHS
jgi:hypothetical protein